MTRRLHSASAFLSIYKKSRSAAKGEVCLHKRAERKTMDGHFSAHPWPEPRFIFAYPEQINLSNEYDRGKKGSDNQKTNIGNREHDSFCAWIPLFVMGRVFCMGRMIEVDCIGKVRRIHLNVR